MRSFILIFIMLTLIQTKSLFATSQNIIDDANLLTTTQKETLSKQLQDINSKSGSKLKILVFDDQNKTKQNRSYARNYAKKMANTWSMGKKDIILISLPKKNQLSAYLGEEVNTERTSYESNNILDRAMHFKSGTIDDFFYTIYLLIFQPDVSGFTTDKTHFDRLKYATYEYKYLLENYDLPLTKDVKIPAKKSKTLQYFYLFLALVLVLRLKDDYERWLVAGILGCLLAIPLYFMGFDFILALLLIAVWSSFSKAKLKDLFKESKNPKKWEDRDEDQNVWDDDD